MKVLMFGWEFPPLNSGGLGTACYGLTKALSANSVDVTFVVPRKGGFDNSHIRIIAPEESINQIKKIELDSPLVGYMTTSEYKSVLVSSKVSKESSQIYGHNLFLEVARYGMLASEIAKNESHDVIHCHDWMTYRAGINAQKMSKKPLIIHVHATEFDRGGGNGVNQFVYDLEREGMHACDSIIAVSNFTKNMIINHYGIEPDKIKVVHNAVEFNNNNFSNSKSIIDSNIKTVLFLGRITLQKGPDYFLQAAKKVLEHEDNVRFIFAGSGDMEVAMIEKAAALGISDKVLFSGFLRGSDIDRAYQMADLYVMPSVSEPFGITPLEAMRNQTPTIISKQSGVSEVINHCLKVNFWDIDEMSNMILSVLRYAPLSNCLKENGCAEVMRIGWDNPARKCIQVYNEVCA